MSVSPTDLLMLGKRSLATHSCEADIRSSMSRLYYSAYHHGRLFAERLSSQGDDTQARGGVHARLYTALMHPSVSRTSVQYMKSKSLGYILKAMHAQRIKADYFIDTEVSLQEARAMELQAGGALEI
ncbi:hypothetical protein C1I89_07255 [Achromobacter pulmonis]|uniref:HEPN domain-containing protein n=1 Tax=Achromobacter pulmonis TaxID=1389932 RepID=A0A2N8KKS2_9BURK|nr:hypothetical protein [Achromobacter pulmonis]PND34038.1 hypothetical protein C1I89_07255 [Achromobacter pulmonis]